MPASSRRKFRLGIDWLAGIDKKPARTLLILTGWPGIGNTRELRRIGVVFMKLLEEVLNNRMVLCLYDQSRRIAGDRWVIKLHGEARIRLDPDFFSRLQEEDGKLLGMVKERLGEELIFTLARERNFVSEEEKERATAELLAHIHENLIGYLGRPSFPEKLFRKQYHEQRKKVLLELEIAAASRQEGE